MYQVLIIYPHWYPANLAGVHRPRLTGNFLKEFAWKPIVLTVDQKYYEEKPDPDFEQTFSQDVKVQRVGAFPITRPRIIGDIGLRAFFQLYKGALKIIQSKHIDFIWIPIPSFYTALLGRLIYRKTKVPYGIDYIDPWVRDISLRKDWRHRMSNLLAKLLEPIAVKKASLITGVSYEYYKPVLERNFWRTDKQLNDSITQRPNNSTTSQLNDSTTPQINIIYKSFPYGFDPKDHQIKLDNIQYPWRSEVNIKPWIYAGAFLPNSRLFVKLMFEAIAELRNEGKWDESIRLFFIGTGTYSGKSITQYAQEAGVGEFVHEDRNRFPYLHVLNFLSASDTVMVIGSTEKHYTASKVYQSLLSERPVWTVFHEESSAVSVLEECKADRYLVRYQEDMSEVELKAEMRMTLLSRLNNNDWRPDLQALAKYSARESARKLVEGMEKIVGQ
jgi:hypothetical protein